MCLKRIVKTEIFDMSPWSLKFTNDLGFNAKVKNKFYGIKIKPKD